MTPFSPKLGTSAPVFGSSAARPSVSASSNRARRQPVAAGPIRQPAPGRAGRLVLPDLLAGRRVERVDPVRRAEIQHAVDDERRALEEAGLVAGVERPRALQALDVRRVDLRQASRTWCRRHPGRTRPSCSARPGGTTTAARQPRQRQTVFMTVGSRQSNGRARARATAPVRSQARSSGAASGPRRSCPATT